MKRQLVHLMIIILFFCININGCIDFSNSNENHEDSNKVEIVYYEVFTKWKVLRSINETGVKKYNLMETAGIQQNKPNNTEDIDSYIIRGTVKNNAGYLLDRIEIIAYLYDHNNIMIYNESINVLSLQNTYTKSFVIKIDKSDIEYLNNVDSITIEVFT